MAESTIVFNAYNESFNKITKQLIHCANESKKIKNIVIIDINLNNTNYDIIRKYKNVEIVKKSNLPYIETNTTLEIYSTKHYYEYIETEYLKKENLVYNLEDMIINFYGLKNGIFENIIPFNNLIYSFKLPMELNNEKIVFFNTDSNKKIEFIFNNESVVVTYTSTDSYKYDKVRLLRVRQINDKIVFFINRKKVLETDFKYNRIINEYVNRNIYKLSVNIPVGLLYDNDIEKYINLYTTTQYLKDYNRDIQVCILNTDNRKCKVFDDIVEKYNFDYIYVNTNNEKYFNLGFTRNLYKYLSCSDRIMFIDIDIPIENEKLNEYLKYTDYDIIKPYMKVIQLTVEQKRAYINKREIKDYVIPDACYSISGGAVIYRRSVIDSIGGYEEYRYYGFEDRATDVKILFMNNFNIKYINDFKPHLFHVKTSNYLTDTNDINILKEFHKKYYNCQFKEDEKNKKYIHEYCSHEYGYIKDIIDLHKSKNANLLLFNNKNESPNFKNYELLIKRKHGNIPRTLSTKSRTLIVMGNGRSLKDIDINILRNYDTFGLNSAYRIYDEIDFYPTYFGCFDYLVNESHKDQFEKLVLTSRISEFYFIGSGDKKQELYSDEVRRHNKFKKFNFKHVNVDSVKSLSENVENLVNFGSSGANATQIGILMGYKRIVLVGCDCDYVEKIPEADVYDADKSHRLVIKENVTDNPNYWFDSYQMVGDKYNLPNTSKFQIKSWENIYKYCPDDVEIINCSLISKIGYFKKVHYKHIL